MSETEKLTVKCPQCGQDNVFDQPHAYHAGFGDQGFLYSDSGRFTLTWSLYDSAIDLYFPPKSGYEHFPVAAASIAPLKNVDRDTMMRRRFEEALPSAPDGGRWRFDNPARCLFCPAPISGSLLQTVYYLLYPGSIVTGTADGDVKLGEYLMTPPDTALEPTSAKPASPLSRLARWFRRRST